MVEPILELWLVRHGETTRSRDGRLAGWSDVRLTERGRAEARALRPLLAGGSFAGVWCSDLARTRTTARLAWGRAQTDRRLRELSFGDLEGLRWTALPRPLKESLLGWDGFHPTGGESLDELAARVHAFLATLDAGRHLVFTHGGVVRLLTRQLGVDEFQPTGTLLVVDWTRRLLLRREKPLVESG